MFSLEMRRLKEDRIIISKYAEETFKGKKKKIFSLSSLKIIRSKTFSFIREVWVKLLGEISNRKVKHTTR